ncbi:MAG: hypothetical protein OXU25_03095 [Thaumarchaeota archaeon]|nr:hypothetical protein [Nitrososphaerota archaeon]
MEKVAWARRGASAQSLRCADCSVWMNLRRLEYDRNVDGVEVDGKVPMLECPMCGGTAVTPHVEHAVQAAARKATEGGHRRCRPAFEQRRFSLCEVEFEYDSTDWLAIPMLRQSESERDGYYAPVFFRRAVLLRYMVRDEYTTRQFRDGGSIHFPNGSDLGYGINRNGLVVCWLGELDGIPTEEQRYMLSENTGSDHDVVSGLYAQSRLREGEGETDEQMLTGTLHSLTKTVKEKRGFDLYGLRAAEPHPAKHGKASDMERVPGDHSHGANEGIHRVSGRGLAWQGALWRGRRRGVPARALQGVRGRQGTAVKGHAAAV